MCVYYLFLFLAMNADKYDNEWNKNIFGEKVSHSSILCADFKSEFQRKEILILDKEKSEYLHSNDDNSFFDYYRRELEKIERCEKYGKLGNACLTIIILTTNKPDSLSRLLQNINKSVYNNKRIDLRININRGQSGFYDLETLKIASEFDWAHGSKCSHLSNHEDGLSQWIESSNFSDSTPFLLLEDDVTLSTHFYTALSGAVDTYQATQEWQRGGIGGISLEPPITSPYSLKSYHQLVARYSESMVLSRPILSRAFYPNQLVWRQFTDWVRGVKSGVTKFRTSALADTFAVSQLNNGNKTEWYKGMFGVWFSYFVEMRSGTIGYLLDTKGAIGTWAYRGLDGSENFLSYECSLENAYVKTRIPILNVENPNFRFSPSPSRIEIGT